MATAASNAKMPVTQNRIGRLKKRINQIKIGGQKKEVRKPGMTKVYEDEGSQIPKYVSRKASTTKPNKLQPHGGPPRQPLRNIQPNVHSYHHGYDPDPSRCQADPYRKDFHRQASVGSHPTKYVTYRQYTVDHDQEDYDLEPAYWHNSERVREFYSYTDDQNFQERKAVGIVPPCPIGESDIDLQSLGVSIGELFPPTSSKRHGYLDDWYKHDEYRDDIINYLLEQDHLHTVKSLNFLYKGDIQANMRTILVDWLIQVQVHQDLLDETLHLTVALIDRYHSQHIISLPRYQLLGVGCLFVAAKYCERFPPLIADLVKLTENTYTPDQLLNMELKILAVLQFDMTFIDPHSLMERYLHVFGYHKDKMVRYLSMYILDMSLIEPRCIIMRRAVLVVNIVCLAKIILDENTKYHLIPHCKSEVVGVLAHMLIRSETAEQTAAKVKYSSMSRYHGISHLPTITTSPVVIQLANDMTSFPPEAVRPDVYPETKHHVRFV